MNEKTTNRIFTWIERWGLILAVIGTSVAALAGIANFYISFKQTPFDQRLTTVEKVQALTIEEHKTIKTIVGNLATKEDFKEIKTELDCAVFKYCKGVTFTPTNFSVAP